MPNYYLDFLNSSKLQSVYEVSPARVRQFLDAEIEFVLGNIAPKDLVLDLGCGYGRVTFRLINKARKVIGIDISEENILLAQKLGKSNPKCEFFTMNAADLSFDDHMFDLVICVQNGISAFKIDPIDLLKEAIRVTRYGGTILLSSYSEKFWDYRLEWFQIQAEHGLIGEIDYEHTRNGIIVCKDGFKAITFSAKDFIELASHFSVDATIHEIDNSSIFCKMIVK